MADVAAETKYCSNCKKDISAANFTMHEVHCRRHIVLCEHCDEPVPRSEMEEHFSEHHATVACTQCGEQQEKTQLQEHMEGTCSKRPLRCVYCELELPRCDLNSHQDYCGTRTESCPKCAQFIMKKDLLQHEASNCDYPTPKPATNGHDGDRDRERFVDFPQYDYEFPDAGFDNAFAMDELSRMMENTRMQGSLNSQLDMAGFGRPRNAPGTQSRSYTNNNTTRTRKSTTNRKSELNRQRQRGTWRSRIPVVNEDIDEDLMLAMRLQHEEDEDIGQLIRQIEKNSPPVQTPVSPATSPANVNTFPDDDDLIPCEFCGEPFPVDILVQHQSGCDPMSTVNWNEDTSWRGERNNEVEGGSRGRGIAIPVINNLDSQWRVPVQEIPIQRECLDEAGEVLLPCEFCTETFPYELLIQHQSVCEFNPNMTPRVQTPATPSQRKPHLRNKNLLSLTAQEMLMGESRSHRHQGLPTFGDDPDDEINHLQGARNGGRSHNSGARNNTPSSRSVASKYGAPVSRFDEHLTKGSRPSQRSRDDVSGRTAYSDRAGGRTGNTRRGSETRTRSTLDELLKEPDPGQGLGQGPVVPVGSSRKKAAKNEDNLVKRGSTSTGAKKKPTHSTSASTRDVMRELSRPTNTQHKPSRRRTNGSLNEDDAPPFPIQAVSQARPRNRTNQVFNAEVRGHNSETRRKPSSRRPFEEDDDNI
ncbi:TRAF-type zinc finger domain-containing protein 1-like [Haliotis rubra]|uniref:TRAF-type zinc finger domain-containing protein 1-like n=1 Tax=Haliotis rubra TaxID=36100 RepID=UPI001EE5C4CD|nr:TRAF-type zinc finger domain-containing protein 1-like [Haliotis rubra]